jgi:RNA polymerase sigma factor (sigma-70 family)
MPKPDVWVAFTDAVGTGQEVELRGAFERLYRSELGEMTRFAHWCVRKGHNPDLVPGFVLDPEEVAQDAFVQLFLRCRGIREDPKHWLLGFIRNKLRYDAARSRREDKSKPDAQRQLDGWQEKRRAESSLSPDRRKAIREAVNSLPKRMRAVVISLYYRKESVATSAAILGITENAVRQTQGRALRKIEAALQRMRGL